MTLDQAVSKSAGVMSGALCFRGTRVPVSTLFAHLQAGELDEFYLGFPNVTPEMVETVLRVSEEALESRVAMAEELRLRADSPLHAMALTAKADVRAGRTIPSP